jgi:hypothetical protein
LYHITGLHHRYHWAKMIYWFSGSVQWSRMSQEYYTVLARTMAAAGRDHAQLRTMVYQLARIKLRKELYGGANCASLADTRQQIFALETAIEQLESDVVGSTKHLASSSKGEVTQRALVASTDSALVVPRNSHELTVPRSYAVELLPPVVPASRYGVGDKWQLPASSTADARVYTARPVGKASRAFWWRLQLVLATILGVVIFDATQTPVDLPGVQTRDARDVSPSAVPEPQPNAVPASVGVPVPTTYGVYALSHGQLTDLGTLPIRIPDQSVAISALISEPSRTTLPDGRLQFIVFRRDLVSSAPDRAMVRVVAQVMRALTFDAGKPKTIAVTGSWAVRGNTYELRVAPVSGNPEMVTIGPENPDFSFPAGRYALLVGDAAYDFTVAGPITDPAHCLERTDTMGAPVYYECRSP